MNARIDVLGLPAREAAALRADTATVGALAALARRGSSVRLAFTDDNGPKGGPDIRCTITVGLPHRGRVHAEERATTPRLALRGALAHLERQLAREAAMIRASRRRPKKYYAARAVAG